MMLFQETVRHHSSWNWNEVYSGDETEVIISICAGDKMFGCVYQKCLDVSNTLQ